MYEQLIISHCRADKRGYDRNSYRRWRPVTIKFRHAIRRPIRPAYFNLRLTTCVWNRNAEFLLPISLQHETEKKKKRRKQKKFLICVRSSNWWQESLRDITSDWSRSVLRFAFSLSLTPVRGFSSIFLRRVLARSRKYLIQGEGETTVARRESTSRCSTSLVNGVVEPGKEGEEAPMVGR